MSNFIVEIIRKRNDILVYIIPTIIESHILLLLALFGQFLISQNPNFLTCALLFRKGIQNSLVTKKSNSVVRTTHLTGLFTDLGIELSQLFFYKEKEKLLSSIKLRLTIITFFFLGGLLGGILYSILQLYILAIAATVLIAGVFYDYLKLKAL